jgi:hypothetical protein
MIGGEWKRAGEDRQGPLLVRFGAVSHSRWRHIGSHIVAFSSVLGTVSDGLVRPFFVGRAADLRSIRRATKMVITSTEVNSIDVPGM